MTWLLADESFPFEHVHGHVLLIGHDPQAGQAIDVPVRAQDMVRRHVPTPLKWLRSTTVDRPLAV